MKIYCNKKYSPDNADNFRYANISLTQNILRIEFWVRYQIYLEDEITQTAEKMGDSIEINLEEVFAPYNCICTMLTKKEFNPVFVKPFNVTSIESTRDAYSIISYFKKGDYKTSFDLFFGETINDIILVSVLPCKSEDIEVECLSLSPSNIASMHYPAYKAKKIERDARRELLLAIDPNDSLSYIEAQLDILTRIVLELAKENLAIRQAVPGFNEFEAAFASTNLFNIKPFDKCLGEITKLKTKTRNLQNEYYKAKEKISE